MSGAHRRSAGLLFTVALTISATPLPAQEFSGQWQHFGWVGFRNWDEGRCSALLFQERRYNLQRRPGAADLLSGFYTSTIWGRMTRNMSGTCRLPGQKTSTSIYMVARIWDVQGFLKQSTARMQGKYGSCLGDDCDNPNYVRAPFISNLTIVDGDLVDRDEAHPKTPRFTFHSLPWHQAQTSEARAGLKGVLATLLSGTRDEARAVLSPRFGSPEQIDTFLVNLPVMRTSLKQVVDRVPFEAYVLEVPPTSNAAIGRVYLLSQQANTQDGRRWLETVLLERVNGRWLLATIMF
jgi:hypothetical protein